jgi:small subunit ribosomal protein S8
MTVSDPLADLLTRIRNAQMRGHETLTVAASRLRRALLDVLLAEGYLDAVDETEDGGFPALKVRLRYSEGRPAIRRLKRVSRPGLRIYRRRRDLPHVLNGYGICIVSTSRGVMSDRDARAQGLGGEVLCIVA